jgi:hypothetical protein
MWRGDIFGVQIIESKRLKEEDGGVWLTHLRKYWKSFFSHAYGMIS